MRTFSLLLQSLILKLAVIAHAANSSEFKLEDELINFFGYTFEYWDSANWTDASRGGVTWKVEDGNSEELNDAKVRPPPPPSGNKYLRLHPSPDGTFSPAVFSGFYYETGGQQFKRLRFSFEYWLSSEYFEHNNIQVTHLT